MLAVLVLAWVAGANAAERWWRPVVPEVMFGEECADGTAASCSLVWGNKSFIRFRW